MKIAQTRVVSGVLVVACLFVVAGGCDLNDNSSDNRGRIVVGQSVDGVALGADTIAVRRVLGFPSRIDRGAGFVHYQYASGRHAGMSIHFALDAFRQFEGKTAIALSAPYSGRTRDGIGIGTTRSDVLVHLGEPEFSDVGSAGNVHDRYVLGSSRVGLLYDEELRILSITMSGPE